MVLYLLFVLILIAVFAPYIANDRPLYCIYEGNTLYPAFVKETRTDSIFNPEGEFVTSLQYDITDWRQLNLTSVVWAPIPYSPGSMDRYNRDYAAPGGEQRYKNADGEIVGMTQMAAARMNTLAIGVGVYRIRDFLTRAEEELEAQILQQVNLVLPH